MSLLAALALLSPALSAEPLLDLGLTAYSGTAGGVAEPMSPDVPLMLGVHALGWVTPKVGVGARVTGGSYGVVRGDEGNAFAFVEGQVQLSPAWSAGLGVGTPVIWIEHYCVTAPCSALWEEHHPILALDATRDLSFGHLHLPLSLRAELSQPRWAVGVDLGVDLRLFRRG